MTEHLREFLARPRVVANLRMTLFSVYGLVIIGQDIVNYQTHENVSLWAVDVALWVLLLIDYVRRIRRAEDKKAFILRNLGYPIFLLTGALIPIDHPWLVALPLILGFALQVRELAAGHALTFSFALVLFILVVCSMTLYIVEKDQPQTTFADPGPVIAWSIARLFRVYGTNAESPVSNQGQEIAFVMGVVAIIAAGLFTGQVIRWFVRSDDFKEGITASSEELAALREEVTRMSEQIGRMAEIIERRDDESTPRRT